MNRDGVVSEGQAVGAGGAAYHIWRTTTQPGEHEGNQEYLQVASELFSRSHHFRTLLVDNFQEFLELTLETNTEQSLPPPKEVARKLRSLAIQTVQSWHASYGAAYKKLALAYHYLKQVKKVDFQGAESRTVAEMRREDERQRKMERIYKERVEAASKDMEESYQEILASLTEMESCMGLLLPEFDLLDIQKTISGSPSSQPANECPSVEEQPCCSKDLEDYRIAGMMQKNEEGREGMKGNREGKREEETARSEEEGESLDKDLFLRNSGLISHAYNLDLNLSPGLRVKETEDNEAVVSTVKDLHRLITNKYLPAVQGWIQVFTKSGAEQQLLRRALDLKRSLEATLQKHQELHIDYQTTVCQGMKAASDGEEENDDDFDEVPEKEGYELHIPEHLRAEYGLDPASSNSTTPVPKRAPPPCSSSSFSSLSSQVKRLMEEYQDPTCAATTQRHLKPNPPLPAQPSCSSGPSSSQSSSDQKVVDAPVVPFGLDLYYWGQEQPNAGKIVKMSSQHQFWVPINVDEEVENKELLGESRSRFISFPGSFTPVKHYCSAPLDNGKLCKRQDRLKCPFHGLIIHRDQEGRPCRQEDRLREEQEKRRKREEQSDWRDVELMRDIEATTGENLGSDRVGKKGKGRKKKYPNLSDLKHSAKTARSRLEKKVLNKSSMRRIADVMAKSDQRKHDKFSNQFNYALQ
ncbi:UV-stimulated scaffold protein A isoform X2 [Pungitius pungitius]|uniref:UV-stimulated scaffold protein A isoform X2 n=1 Tax=Pungitius pungitius TaxID=134920 RepID=UPI002E0DDDE0